MPPPTRRLLLAGAAGGALALLLPPRLALAAPAIGAAAPDTSLPDQDGTNRTLSGLRGKTVVLE